MEIIDAKSGEILVGAGWQDLCVKFHRAHVDSAKRCTESDLYIINHILDGRPCAYKCRNGLWDIGIPILVEDQYPATLFLGPFLYEVESPDRDFFTRQAKRFGYDLSAYLAALDRIAVFSREIVNNILDYSVAFADFIADMACKKMRLNREFDERKRAEEALRESEARLRQIIDLVPHKIFVKDWNGKYLLINKAVAEAYNTSASALIGKCHADFHPDKSGLQKMLKDDRGAMASGIKALMKVGKTPAAYRAGLLNYFKHRIVSGAVEGLINKIKTLKRQAYGFRDPEYFKLRLYHLHTHRYSLAGQQ